MLRYLEIADTNFYFLCQYRKRMLARVDHNLLVAPEVLPHALVKTTRCLKKMTVLYAMRLRVKVAVPCVIFLSKIAPMRPSMNKVVRCDMR
jgi:hypothetical protein